MEDQAIVVVDSANEVVDQPVEVKSSVTSLETALQEIARLKMVNDEAIKTRDSAKRKLKEFETNLTSEKEARQGLETKFRDMTVNGALKAALTEAGTVAIDTAFKLVDKSSIKLLENGELDVESLNAVVESLKGEHTILFKQPEAVKAAVPVARASEQPAQNAFEVEMKAAKSQAQIEAVLKKYGK